MAKRSGLGKGLSSLIPADVTTEGAVYREVDVTSVVPNRYQPREHFDEETLVALTASIAEVGVIQPIVVRETGDGTYELIAGERRWRAAKRANLPAVPALVRTTDDVTALETAVVENLHRQDLNALEEAAAYQQLIEEFGLTQDEVAARVGRSRSAVANTIRLLQLPPAVQRMVVESQISAGHARALLATPDRGVQERVARRIVAEGLTVRQVEEELRSGGDEADHEEGAGRSEAGAAPRPSSSRAEDRVGSSASTPGGEVEPGVLELEELLSARLETRVAVKMGKGPGKLVIDFADLDDLERIYRIITPPGTVV